MFVELCNYKHTYGDCNVPTVWKENPKLAGWCSTNRYALKKRKISPDRIKRLEALGFAWEPFDHSWNEMFVALQAYKQKYGHCNVPNRWADNPKLGPWCGGQRYAFQCNKLPPDRIERLEQLGFVWDVLDSVWEQMFSALTVYKSKYGDCNVPVAWKENPKLGSWCGNQRSAYGSKMLSVDRVTRLDHLGFVWDKLTTAWEKMFAELSAYKNAHGDCNVPEQFKDNSKLATWCGTQRRSHKSNKLAAGRAKRLEAIGFQFRAKGAKGP